MKSEHMLPPVIVRNALFLILPAVSLTGCDLYLPGCGSASILEQVDTRTIRAVNLENFIEVSGVTEQSSSLKLRERTCQASIQPKPAFLERYNHARNKLEASRSDNVLGLIGKSLMNATLPERLGTAIVKYRILRSESAGGFDVLLSEDSLDAVSDLANGYRVADFAIQKLDPSPVPDQPTKNAPGNI